MDADQYDKLTNKLDEIQKDLRDTKESLAIIDRAVLGEERAGHRGLVKRMDYMETWKVNLDIRMATYAGFAVCLGYIVKYLVKGAI